jgi:hypothetical protein
MSLSGWLEDVKKIMTKAKSFTDAEGGENDIKNLLDIDRAHNFTQSLQGFAQFEGHKLGCHPLNEDPAGFGGAFRNPLKAGAMTRIDRNRMRLLQGAGAQDELADRLAEGIETRAIAAGHRQIRRTRLPTRGHP